MQIERLWAPTRFMVIVALSTLVCIGSAFATTSSSPNYQLSEADFTAGTSLESCSGQYCAHSTLGDLAIGSSEAVPLTAEFGSLVEEEPVLEVIVEPGSSNLGVLSTDRTATKTSVIKVRNYLSGGYVLQMIGDPPKYQDHTLATPKAPSVSSAGTEQFAINAVANTSPAVGSDPVQVPSNQTSFGFAEDQYNTPNLFKYISGDVVARSNTESGQTNYTISMIVNISNSTPAGHFTSDFAAVVIPVY